MTKFRVVKHLVLGEFDKKIEATQMYDIFTKCDEEYLKEAKKHARYKKKTKAAAKAAIKEYANISYSVERVKE